MTKKFKTVAVAVAFALALTTVMPLAYANEDGQEITETVISEEATTNDLSDEITETDELKAGQNDSAVTEDAIVESEANVISEANLEDDKTVENTESSTDDMQKDAANNSGIDKASTAEATKKTIAKGAKLTKSNSEVKATAKTGDVAINEINFPDDEFRKYVKNNFDKNSNDILEEAELLAVTEINIIDTINIKNMEGIGFFTNITKLSCYSPRLTSLDVSKNTALTRLSCSSTDITSLDVSKNTALELLYCEYTDITSLDVSNNTALRLLICHNTNIKSLDLSNNTALKVLQCHDTDITSLDVSKNTNLDTLYYDRTAVAYCNLGDMNCTYFKPLERNTIDIDLKGNSFDITKEYPGIDVSKIKIISGGTLDGNIITFDDVNTPVVYEYDCGTNKGQPVTLEVTLIPNLLDKGDTSISINKTLDASYTGNPVTVDESDLTVTGSDETLIIKYYQDKNGTWEEISSAPVNAGHYKVVIEVPENGFYNAGKLEQEFTISKATPTNVQVPTGLKATEGQTLDEITLPDGFTWVDGTQVIDKDGTVKYQAVYTPDDTENYETVYVDITIEVTAKDIGDNTGDSDQDSDTSGDNTGDNNSDSDQNQSENPGNNNGGSNENVSDSGQDNPKTNETDKNTTVKTGDDTSIAILLLTLIASGTGLATILSRKRNS